jgi:hypothetical protein
MSDTLKQVIEQASTDAAFRAQRQSQPDRALAAYQLTADERLGLLRGVVAALAPLGVDTRVSKIDNPTLTGDAYPLTPWE